MTILYLFLISFISTSNKQDVDILIFIPVRNTDYSSRCGLRDSWLNLINDPISFDCELCSKYQIKYYFIADDYSHKPIEPILIRENVIFKDFIFLPINKASYHRVMIKIQHMMKYAIDNFNFKLFFKMDPDIYLHVDRFVKLLSPILDEYDNKYNDVYIGSIYGHQQIPKIANWHDTEYLNKAGTDQYLTHSKGAAYGLSFNLVSHIANLPGPILNMLGGDDVEVGTLLGGFDIDLFELPTNLMGPTRDDEHYDFLTFLNLTNLNDGNIHRLINDKYVVEHYSEHHVNRAKFLAFLLKKSMKINLYKNQYLTKPITNKECFVDIFNDKAREMYKVTHNVFQLTNLLDNPHLDLTKFYSMFELVLSRSKCSLPFSHYKWKRVSSNNNCFYCEYDGIAPPIWIDINWKVSLGNEYRYEKWAKSMATDLFCILKRKYERQFTNISFLSTEPKVVLPHIEKAVEPNLLYSLPTLFIVLFILFYGISNISGDKLKIT